MVRIAHDPETRAYFERRVKEGRTKRDVIRILKRYVAREVYRHLPRGWDLRAGLAHPRPAASAGYPSDPPTRARTYIRRDA